MPPKKSRRIAEKTTKQLAKSKSSTVKKPIAKKRAAPTKTRSLRSIAKTPAIVKPVPISRTRGAPKTKKALDVPPKLQLTRNVLDRLKSIVSNSSQFSPPLILHVQEIHRFINDQQSVRLTGQPSEELDSEGYDIVLTDGVYLVKVLLASRHNPLVRQGILQPHTTVEIKEISLLLNEVALGAPAILLLKEMAILSDSVIEESTALRESLSLAWSLDMALDFEQQCRPLIGSRDYYLSLWNDDDIDPADLRWTEKKLFPSLPSSDLKNVPLLKEGLAQTIGKRTHPPLIGRISAISHLNHYGKSDDFKDKFPFQFFLTLCDSSLETIEVIFWNTTVRDYFRSLNVGMVVALEDYKVQKAFSKPEGLEISINSRNPAGKIDILISERGDSLCVQPIKEALQKRCPLLNYQWADIKVMSQWKDSDHVDIIGFIFGFSPLWRERSLRKKSPFSFSEYRYLLIRSVYDPAANVIVKAYTNSQRESLLHVQPGHLLVATRLKVYSHSFTSRERSVYVASSFYTKYTVAKEIKELAYALCLTEQQSQDLLPSTVQVEIAGPKATSSYLSIPVPGQSYWDYRDMFGEQDFISTSMISQLLPLRIHFRESTRIVFQGYLKHALLRRKESNAMKVAMPLAPPDLPVICDLFSANQIIECQLADAYKEVQLCGMIIPSAYYYGTMSLQENVDDYPWQHHLREIFGPFSSDMEGSLPSALQQILKVYKDKKVIFVADAYRISGTDILCVLRKVFFIPE